VPRSGKVVIFSARIMDTKVVLSLWSSRHCRAPHPPTRLCVTHNVALAGRRESCSLSDSCPDAGYAEIPARNGQQGAVGGPCLRDPYFRSPI